MHLSLWSLALLASSVYGAASGRCLEYQVNQPLPPHAVCFENGTIHRPALLHRYPKVGPDACLKRCEATPKCRAFGFAYQSGDNCALYGRPLENMGFKRAASSPRLYFDKSCFSCLPHCRKGAALLANGNFNAAGGLLQNWTYAGVSQAPPAQVVGQDGSPALGADVYQADAQDNSATLTQSNISSCAVSNVLYTLAFQYRFAQGLNTSALAFSVWSVNGLLVPPPAAPTAWASYLSPTFGYSGATPDLAFEFQNTDPVNHELIELDNVVLAVEGLSSQ